MSFLHYFHVNFVHINVKQVPGHAAGVVAGEVCVCAVDALGEGDAGGAGGLLQTRSITLTITVTVTAGHQAH